MNDERHKYLSDLWSLLQNTSDKKLKDKIVNGLSENDINDLRTFKNPYKRAVIDKGPVQELLFSFTNLEEKYQKRFVMTSLIGFVYRMLDEWEPPQAADYPSENDANISCPLMELTKEASRTRPQRVMQKEVERINARLAVLEPLITTRPVEVVPEKPPTVAKKNGKAVRKTPSKGVESPERVKETKEVVESKEVQETTDTKEAKDTKEAVETKNIEALVKEASRLIKERFILQARILNYQKYLIKDSRRKAKETLETSQAELSAHRASLEMTRASHQQMLKRYQKRVKYISMEPLERAAWLLSDTKAEFGPDDWALVERHKTLDNIPPKDRLRIERKYQEVLSQPDIKKTDEQHQSEIAAALAEQTHIQSIITRLETTITSTDSLLRDLTVQMDEYRAKWVSLTAEYSARSGWNGPLKAHPLHGLLPDPSLNELPESEHLELIQTIKDRLSIAQTREEYLEEERDRIAPFLDSLFSYNPDNHVVSAYAPNYADPTRGPLPTSEAEKQRALAEQKYELLLIPPSDTFHRWTRYTENNYEQLRQATDDIYCERSDFELMLLPYCIVEGADAAEAKKRGEEWKRKHTAEFEGSVLSARISRWNFLGPFSENRKAIDFYSKETEVIKRIIDQNQEDEKIGTRLMKDRAEKKKKENVKTAGPHAPGLADASRALGSGSLDKFGAKPISDIKTPGVIPRDARESTKDEIEVGVHQLGVRRIGRRRVRGTGEAYKFHIPTEALPDDAINVTNSAKAKTEAANGNH
jgi:hypothetical protein